MGIRHCLPGDPHWLAAWMRLGLAVLPPLPFPTAKTWLASSPWRGADFSHFPASLVQSTPFSPSIPSSIPSSVFLFLHFLLLRPSFLSVVLAIAYTEPGDNSPLPPIAARISTLLGHASSLDRPPPPTVALLACESRSHDGPPESSAVLAAGSIAAASPDRDLDPRHRAAQWSDPKANLVSTAASLRAGAT